MTAAAASVASTAAAGSRRPSRASPARCSAAVPRSQAVTAAPSPAAFGGKHTSLQGRNNVTGSSFICSAEKRPTVAAAAVAEPALNVDLIRNIAIIAHVDHGKTTLVDAMLSQAKVFRANQAVQERIMDSNDLERERGITILAKNTAVNYGDNKINIIDTPGHADFGGEVERVLNMCDGVLLLVDSVEGPMPQTRFVLRKALALRKKVIVVVNKIDRPAARADWVIDRTFELFEELGADDEQCDFPVVYASGVNGVAGNEPEDLSEDLAPLFECIVNEVPSPKVDASAPAQILVTNLDYDEHKGRVAIGRISGGSLEKGASYTICTPEGLENGEKRTGRITELFIYNNFDKVPVASAQAGDICAFTGMPDVGIGESVCDSKDPIPLPTIEVEEPTVTMTFLVNTSPFAGQEGKFVTSRNLKERLDRELERNLALRVERGESADQFIVSGRGTLHIGVLMENMRREGYEFAVGPPRVITKSGENGQRLEPIEEAVVEVPEVYMGAVVDMLGQRKGQMLDMSTNPTTGTSTVKYSVPTRGLLGLRSGMLTATRGTAIINTVFSHFDEWQGDISTRDNGSLVAHEQGQVTSFACESAQQRGVLFVKPGDQVYEGMVVGIHQRPGDLKVNVAKKKAVNNIRSATKENTTGLNEPKIMTLDDALEYVVDDELVEVTPISCRIRKLPKASKFAR
eukprot:CAMPEP_0117661198 /NCGR_PEP_ID=MMETSP0804-20121206/7412_1 /TAXON_ID=1074897 /ORGANISM="Tetraselmis astigmatica, Strain CCMP880" /LENGTH=687 /DNA_ID=CAMNT_0005468055 /DNA_START=254 /DNA_END=2317 /DNA_ORIENTATION=+